VPKRVTLADVARLAGVSTASASLVLNRRKGTRLSFETHDRVFAAARQLGYRPNIAAQSLRTERTQSVAFISDFVATTRFAGRLISGAMKAADELGQVLLVVETEGDLDREQRAINTVLDRGVDGIVFAAMTEREVKIPQFPESEDVVLLNATNERYEHCVLPDELQGGATAATLLTDAGHRRIGLVGYDFQAGIGGSRSLAVDRRLLGIKTALGEANAHIQGQVGCEAWEPHEGFAAARAILDTPTRPSALLCLNDRLAFGAYQAAAELGLTVPEDLSIVSFDDDEVAGYLRPGLTTVALPHERMGRLAVSGLLTHTHPQEVLVEMPVVQRGSIAHVKC
jgi:LacI family transcriptional regulator